MSRINAVKIFKSLKSKSLKSKSNSIKGRASPSLAPTKNGLRPFLFSATHPAGTPRNAPLHKNPFLNVFPFRGVSPLKRKTITNMRRFASQNQYQYLYLINIFLED
ncbi:hypothetical protein R80B4_02106 [Fibrobacteres bacterium R8-0-B4]